MPSYIDKIGVELELAVNLTEDGHKPDVTGFRHTHDGSINSRHTGRDTALEYVSSAMDYHSSWDKGDMNKLESGIYELYKKHGAAANDSMGTHIHISFNKDHYYYALASEKFIKHFEEKVKESRLYEKNDRLKERFSGVHYAEPVNGHSEIQSTIDGGRNYKHFTYRTGMKTIEFRLLPAFNTKLEVKQGINLITSIVNSFLYNKKQEFEETEEVKHDEEDLMPDENELSEEDVKEMIHHV